MSRMSRGCQQCRSRKVKCDQGRPSCKRCIGRGDTCTGYRSEDTLIFRHENNNIVRDLHEQATIEFVQSGSASKKPLRWTTPSGGTAEKQSHQIKVETSPQDPVLFQLHDDPSEDQIASGFFDRFVLQPCNDGSSPGFLEHLPGLFKDIDIKNRYVLRYAVLATAHASSCGNPDNGASKEKAFHYYGLALQALSYSLESSKSEVDDYILMTIVVLDLFESLYSGGSYSDLSSTIGAHAQGMKHMLRLKENEQEHDPRTWSLLRLTHHRLQKHNLTRNLPPMSISTQWLDDMHEDDPYVQFERRNLEVTRVCHRGRVCLEKVDDETLAPGEVVSIIREMRELDRLAVDWHAKPHWHFKTVSRDQITTEPGILACLPSRVQLHSDAWIAYEWNYHRTGRIRMHEKTLQCLDRLDCYNNDELKREIRDLKAESTIIIRSLADEVLSTVPQTFGDIDANGNVVTKSSRNSTGSAIGGYFLLWPIKTIKASSTITAEQTTAAEAVFERIRECTGMKAILGDASKI